MEAFQYEALNAAGRTVSGVVQADTARQARTQLRAQGLLPSMIGQVHARKRARQVWARGISAAELSLVTRQMATLLDSGLTMEQSLNALIEEAVEPMTREVLTGVKTEVTAGLSLAGRWAPTKRVFRISTGRWCMAARNRARCRPCCSISPIISTRARR